MSTLIERSSLGTKKAAASRARVQITHAQQIVAAAARNRPADLRTVRPKKVGG